MMIVLAAFGLMSIANSAMARSPMPLKWEAPLVHSEVDPKISWHDQVVGGDVKINYGLRKLLLTVRLKDDDVKIELPIVSRSLTGCGSTVLRAFRDLRHVDGARQEIVLIDNTGMHCKTLIAVPATEIRYMTSVFNRHEGKIVESRSRFTAETLRPYFGQDLDGESQD